MHATFRGWGGFLRRALTREAPFTPELRERLTRPYPDEESGYALGWHLESHERLGVLWNHPGSNRMWRSQQIVVPEHGFALLLATNQADTAAVRAIDQLAERLLERVPAHLPRSGTRSTRALGLD